MVPLRRAPLKPVLLLSTVLRFRPAAHAALGAASCGLLLLGCFSGDVTIGAVCADASDCGPAQQCRHELCGRCGNGEHEAGELCYSDPVEVADAPAIAMFRIADLDRDGRDEVVVVDEAGTLRHLSAQGGVLGSRTITTPSPVTTLALGDGDGDGEGDIVAASGTLVTVLAADDQGDFSPIFGLDVGHVIAEATVVPRLEQAATLGFVDDVGALHVIDLVEGAVARHIDVGTQVHVGPAVDFDDDENLDLAVVDERQNRLAIVTGGSWDGFTRLDVGRGPTAVVAYDRDRDGRLDFMTLDRFGRTVTLVSAAADRGLRALDSLALGTAPIAATAFDADLDGEPDVFVGTDVGVEFWRGEAGRNPESVMFATGGVQSIGVGRFGPLPVLELVTLADGRLRRQAVNP